MVILVAGLPGSGKSYFAERLAGHIGAIYINSDQVRNAIHARGKYSNDDKDIVYNEVATEASLSLKLKRDVVIDATFFRAALRNRFLQLAQRYNAPVYMIEVKAEESLIRERLEKPREYSEADFDVYTKVKLAFEEITTPHLTLISMNDNIEDMLERAHNYIGI